MSNSRNKCKHNTNVYISESAYEHITHALVRGEVSHFHEAGSTTDKIYVTCDTCGFEKFYSRYALPKWVRNLFDMFHDYEDGEKIKPDKTRL